MTTARATTRIEAICEGIIEAGWLLALGLVPLSVNIYSNRSYEPDKVAVLRSLVVVMVVAWAWKVASGGRLFVPAATSPGAPGDYPPGAVRRALQACREAPIIALVTLLGLALVVGSMLSVDPRLSWFGSYARAQGTWTQLGYLAVFALAAGHLRTGSQWRRVGLVVVTTGAAVSVYALLQAVGADPVETTRHGTRVHSTLGNSIFLGGYLLMVMFVTVVELGRHLATVAVAPRNDGARGSASRWLQMTRTAVLAAVVIVQLVALVLTQSRGPFLGLLAGGYIFVLLALVLVRRSAAGVPGVVRSKRVVRWALPATLAAALIGVLVLVAFNAGDGPPPRFRTTASLGRLGSVLDPDARTTQVRLFIWRAVAELLASDEPLAAPDGTPDRLHTLRPVIGTGPETFSFAVNRFVSPRLGQLEDRGTTPDRAHNEAFELIVMQGVLGVIIWLAVLGTVIGAGLRRLDLIESGRDNAVFWVVFLGGAALGATAPWLASGEATLSGVGLSIGLVLGLSLFVTLQALISARRRSVSQRIAVIDALVVALLSAVIAHTVEVQVGIAITATRLHFWFFAAALVGLAQGWLVPAFEDATTSPLSSPSQRSKAARTRKVPGAAGDHRPHVRASSEADVIAALTGTLCLPWIYSMTKSQAGVTTVRAVLADSWLVRDAASGAAGLSVLTWLVLATILVAGVLGVAAETLETGRVGRRRARSVVVFLAVVGSFAIAQATQVGRAAGRAADPAEVPVAAEIASTSFATFVWSTVLLCLAIGIVCGLERHHAERSSRRRIWLAAATAVVLSGGGIAVIQRFNVDPIRADVLVKTGRHLTDVGRFDVGLAILDHAAELDRGEPMLHLVRGRALIRAAVAAGDGAGGGEFFDRAGLSLERARALAPLDPDHSANLARLHTTRANLESDPARRLELAQRAGEEYAAALRLRPASVVFLNEYGRLLLTMGWNDAAERELEWAVSLDEEYVEPYVALGALWESRATAAATGHDMGRALALLERATAMYDRALMHNPDHESARQGLARVRNAMTSAWISRNP